MRYLRTFSTCPSGSTARSPPEPRSTWPAAAWPDPPTEAQLQEVADAGLPAMDGLHAQVHDVARYTGYRVIIAAIGDWRPP